jgi:rare lipoprotein A
MSGTTHVNARVRRVSKCHFAAALALVLAACAAPPPKPAAPAAPALPPPSSKYYSDDGPPLAVPGNLDAIPDAVPRLEPLHRFANRPYTVLGREYVPATSLRPYRERGTASWYGRKFHGQKTSIGEVYDMFAMTAAHPTLPLPSYARVTSAANGRSVIVRVNDRGPFRDGRVIDLSSAAAMRLGIAATGTGEVEVQRLTHREIAAASASTTLAAAPAAAAPTLSPSAAPAASGRWAVQLGAFAAAERAQQLLARVQAELAKPQTGSLSADLQPRIENDGGLHRVLLGALSEREAAAALAARLAALLGGDVATYVVPR